MEAQPILLVAVSPELEASLGVAIGRPQSILATPDLGVARAALGRGKPAVAVVGLAQHPPTDALELVRELSARGVAVVILGACKDPDLILATLRAGAREFLVAGEERQLERTVQSLLEASGAVRLGTITAVLPAKGGMGATILATHLGGALHRSGKRACVVDLDLELGDVLTFLDMAGTYTLGDVASNMRRLDRDLLDSSVPRHKSGLYVLSQSEKVTEADRVNPETISQVLRFLRHHYDHLVLDGLRDFGDLPLAALDLADRILLVVTQEVPAVRNAQRRAEYLRQLGFDVGRILVVVNRYQKSSSITPSVIEETVHLPVVATIGNDFQSLMRAVNQGVLVWDESRRSAVARDVEGLAQRLAGAPAPAAAARTSLLGALLPTRMATHGA
jgi:pilus assembly protein CpaE